MTDLKLSIDVSVSTLLVQDVTSRVSHNSIKSINMCSPDVVAFYVRQKKSYIHFYRRGNNIILEGV